MATIINNPGGNEGSSDSSLSIIIGIAILAIVAGAFFVYALPAIRGNGNVPEGSNINVNLKLPAEKTTPTPTP